VLEVPVEASYTRSLMVMPDDPANIMIVGGGRLGGADNKVQVSVVNVEPKMPTLGLCNV
jgi:hypothetical protein